MSTPVLIYGSYGYTGELIVDLALKEGLKPILAGRTESKLKPQAEKLGLEYRVFSLDDEKAVNAGLEGITVVSHCAGPFSRTAKQMALGCIRNKVHYLDITGEIEVFETMAHLGSKAEAAGIMLMPGTGFDVVPTDCLALHLKNQLPDATELTLAFCGVGTPSHGTQTTIVENMSRGGAIRKDGKIIPVPSAWKVREIDFGDMKRTAMTIPWGDVSTSFHSTGIPNIMVFMAAPASLARMAKLSRIIGPILGSGPVQSFMKSRIPEGGPSPEDRAKGKSWIWGEVKNAAGKSLEGRLKTPEGYDLTAATNINITQKVLTGNAPAGFQTPAKAYGADLILEIEGCVRS